MKNIGFNVNADDDYNTYFTAEDESGNEISISFDEDCEAFKVDISLNRIQAHQPPCLAQGGFQNFACVSCHILADMI